MDKDTLIIGLLGVSVLVLALVMEFSARSGRLPQWLSRKILHLGAVGACAAAPALLSSSGLLILILIVTIVEPILLWLVATRRLFSEASGRRSWGIALFPVAYLLLLLLNVKSRELIIWPMAILAVSDALAATVGTLLARRYFVLTGDRKSWIGSTVFAISALGLLIGWALSTGGHPAWIWAYLVWVALVLAGIEALGSNGFDNVWIPWAAACLLHSVHKLDAGSVAGLWLALGLGIVFARFTIRKKALSLDGAVMAVLVGLWVMRFAGPLMLVPLFFFLGSSTLLGRLVRQADAADAKHGKARDYWQVICNGGIYAGLATLMGTNAFNDETYDGIVAMAMIVSLAISTADTWASEIGMYYKGVTWDILRRRPLPPGVSGGVSFEGNVGGAVGAGCMAAMYCLGIAFKTREILPYFDLMFMLPAFGVIMVVGVMGMQLDSLLGAGLQARYRDPVTGDLADTPAPGRELVSGFRWMTNDAVNLISNLVVTLVFLVLLLSLVPFHMD